MSNASRKSVHTSTRTMSGTGLKKCRPTKRGGRFIALARWMIEIDEVFVATMASFFATASTYPRIFSFSASSSVVASTMKSQVRSAPIVCGGAMQRTLAPAAREVVRTVGIRSESVSTSLRVDRSAQSGAGKEARGIGTRKAPV